MDVPKLRAVEPIPADQDRFYLRDPRRISDVVLLVSRPTLFIISLFDGEHSLLEVQEAFARATGEILPRQKVEEIIATLDEALFLDNARFSSAQAEVVRRYHDSDVRQPINAGLSYPAGEKELAAYLGELFARAENEALKARSVADASDLDAIVVPHIDLARGGEAYAAVYRRLAERSGARRFVVLGICHHPTLHSFALTRKDYDTPLGRVRTDREFVDSLAAACHTDFLADDIAHRDEHSIEFQMLFLRYLFGGHSELCAARDISVVPVLCSSFQEYMRPGTSPRDSGEAAEFLGALGDLLAGGGGSCLVAAVDFAHLGRQFGQELTVTDEVVREAEADDRRMMERITDRDAEGFFRLIVSEGDRRNVCGVPALYSLLHLLGPGPSGRVARYGQAVDRAGNSIVTFAGIEIPGAASV